jgi:hypothetical protein
MKAQILRGPKQEIAEAVVRITGEVREAIVLVEEPSDSATPAPPAPGEDIFAEMEPYMVHVGNADDSREAIYTRMEGE